MIRWEDWGHDPWGMHRWVKPVEGTLYIVSSGRLGLHAGIHYRGILRLPLGHVGNGTVEQAKVFLDRIYEKLMAMSDAERHAAIMGCGRTYLLPLVPE